MDKRLEIPYVPVLDVLDLSSNMMVMEEHGLRLPIMTCNWREQFPYTPVTAVDIAYTDNGLYVRFLTRGKGLRCEVMEDGGPVHKDSCVEVFLSKPGEKEYYNFEFNCCGVCSAAKRASRENSMPFTEVQYQHLRRSSSIRLHKYNEEQNVHSYTVAVMIPFSLLGYWDLYALPNHILFNFYKCGDETSYPHYASWQPIDTPAPDFHRPETFAPLFFGSRTKHTVSL